MTNDTLKNTLNNLVARELNSFKAGHFQEIAGRKAFFRVRAFVFRYLKYIKKVVILKNWLPLILFFLLGGFFCLLKADLCFQVCSSIIR